MSKTYGKSDIGGAAGWGACWSNVGKVHMEVEMSDLAEVLTNALSLDVRDRAALVERLLASLDELSAQEVERLLNYSSFRY